MPRTILVIGNGFDKAHGLPTAYGDFLKVMKNPDGFIDAFNLARESVPGRPNDSVMEAKWLEYLTNSREADITQIERMVDILKSNSWAHYYANCNAEIEGWVDFEQEMLPVLKLFNSIVTSGSQYYGDGPNDYAIVSLDDLEMSRIANLWPEFIKECSISGRENHKLDITVNSEYSDKQYGVIKKKLINDLKSELDEFVDAFCIYLSEIVGRKEVETKSLFENMKVDGIINFNYTATPWKYKSLSEAKMYYVHGSTLNKDKNKMIFGVNTVPDDAEYRFKDFEKRYQRLCNSTNLKYRRATGDNDFELIVFGHSLDMTDESVLKPMIDNAHKITVYYHVRDDGSSDRKDKIRNLMIMLGDEKAEDMLYNGRIELKEG